jgi:6-phosphofructokinase 1
VIPEFPLNYDRFAEEVYGRYQRQKHIIIVVAEGARFTNGSYISADENEKDDFGHPRFRGSAETLANKLKDDLRKYFDTRNVNAVNPSYLYRSGIPLNLDLRWAKRLGREAVNLLSRQAEKRIFLTIKKKEKGFSIASYPLSDVKSIDEIHRFVSESFYNPDEYMVTPEGKKYLSEIVPEYREIDYGLT